MCAGTAETSTTVTVPVPLQHNHVVGRDEGSGVFINANPHGKGVVAKRRQQASQSVSLTKVLVDDETIGQTRAGAKDTIPALRVPPVVP